MNSRIETILRRTLWGNALFSTLCATVCMTLGSRLSRQIELSPSELFLLGAQLLVFAAALVFVARRPTLDRGWVLAVVLLFGVADLMWVAGSALALREGVALTVSGQSLVIAVAFVVGCFGFLQLIGIAVLFRQRLTVATA